MEIIRDNDFDELAAICGGCCSCCTCHVYVDGDWATKLPAMEADEEGLLEDSENYRAGESRLSGTVRRVFQAMLRPRWAWDVGLFGRPHQLGNALLRQSEHRVQFVPPKGMAFRRALELDEIARYFELVKQAFEHPLEFVQKAETKAEIERAWLLIFAQNPTYQDLEVRTLDLTLIYRLNQASKNGKDAVVREMTLNSNLFETQVRSALEAYSPCDDDPEAYLPVSR